ncbi:SDR family oxidoreductase [Alicyclobacillus sp. SO9]|uniref:SDR family oxidoreductase n=1 Tax=Alicyclobacillus sp. SO9 TaxID=2665646 RepID=UPI0018E7FBAF|nr:SDR family oxidoreductase [Alicyclobacillus sp. SO9]QQE80215.1 SDR family oxidoreductase [Alicyclobacillus sp. SO9]
MQKILVTGATSGIGLAAATLLAVEGHQVIATGRTEEKLRRVEQAADKANVTIRRVKLDVSDSESISNMKNEVLALTNGYGVDVLVNNAGYAEAGAIEELPLNRLRKQFETNVFGLVAVSQALLPLMRQRQRGKIINISSVLGKVSIPLMGAYTASKHAVEAISDAMRVELADAGVTVSVVAPGSVETNFGSTVSTSIEDWAVEASPYKHSYTKFQNDRMADGGAKPLVIAKTIRDIVQSEHPKARYAATYDSKLMPVATTLLPTKAVDKLLKKYVLGR